ncbi:hypothetical protein [uncultured Oscillibacter sp.]|nr:hypothetical protein [uncultured Oscillibacter sp.]
MNKTILVIWERGKLGQKLSDQTIIQKEVTSWLITQINIAHK